jgi:hypothetical protein
MKNSTQDPFPKKSFTKPRAASTRNAKDNKIIFATRDLALLLAVGGCCRCCWRLLAVAGGCWRLLAVVVVGGCWRLLAVVGGCWRLLAVVGGCWRLLAVVVVGSCWWCRHQMLAPLLINIYRVFDTGFSCYHRTTYPKLCICLQHG